MFQLCSIIQTSEQTSHLNNNLQYEGTLAIAQGLKQNKTLKKLVLSGEFNNVTD